MVGSTARTQFELRDSGPVLVKTLDYLFVDDKAGKPVGIWQFIGRRPIACFGNSDGDQAMLQYTTINNPRPSFGLIVHHTDAEREFAYDASPKSSGKLVEALKEAPQAWLEHRGHEGGLGTQSSPSSDDEDSAVFVTWPRGQDRECDPIARAVGTT